MSVDFALAVAKAGFHVALNKDTGADIEQQLQRRFGGQKRSFKTHSETTVTVTVESIRVRPQYFPVEEQAGIQAVDSRMLFTAMETQRERPTFLERLRALARDQWVTEARIRVSGGDIEDIRPPGFNLSYVTAQECLHNSVNDDYDIESVPNISTLESQAVQADRLRLKIPFNGSIGPYAERLGRGLDFLEYVQPHLDEYAAEQLFALHRGPAWDGDSRAWADREQAKQLGTFVIGQPVDLTVLWEVVTEAKANFADWQNE